MGGGVIAIAGGIALILALVAAFVVSLWAEFGWSAVREFAAICMMGAGATAVVLVGVWLIVFGATQNGWLP